jgi:4-hydroxy-4-methyl-2-oxoglutarate aldolase
MKPAPLAPEQLEKLKQLDSCTMANAIEGFDVRLRNAGFADSSIRCLFEDFPPMVGYAATVRIRTAVPPMEGHSYFYRLDWLDHVLSIPAPRVVVVQDVDSQPGLGSFIGEVHSSILQALGSVGVVTSGGVRDVPAVRAMNFPLFARNVCVSHAFAHVFDFGKPVEVGNLEVRPGDLIHGDRHGVQTIPLEIADKVPARAHRIAEEEQEIIRVCRSADFSLAKLRNAVTSLGIKRQDIKP